jgi:hypothetical protein
MGIPAKCTLFDGPFNNGVEVQMLDPDHPLATAAPLSSSLPPSQSRMTTMAATPTGRWKLMLRSCTASVHLVALLAGPRFPNVILAIVAEHSLLGNYVSPYSGSGSRPKMGLSFLLGSVLTNPHNHNAIVALSAGLGYYGTSQDGRLGGSGRGGSGRSGIMGGGTRPAGWGTSELVPSRLLEIPVSVGITLGVYGQLPRAGGDRVGNIAQILDALTLTSALMYKPYNETWIGRGEEHAAVCLQALLGHVVWTFHLGDTNTYRDVAPSSRSAPSLPKRGQPCHGTRRMMVCLSSVAPSCIGGTDAIPKVGIVRLTAPIPPMLSTGMEITGNASYQNVT